MPRRACRHPHSPHTADKFAYYFATVVRTSTGRSARRDIATGGRHVSPPSLGRTGDFSYFAAESQLRLSVAAYEDDCFAFVSARRSRRCSMLLRIVTSPGSPRDNYEARSSPLLAARVVDMRCADMIAGALSASVWLSLQSTKFQTRSMSESCRRVSICRAIRLLGNFNTGRPSARCASFTRWFQLILSQITALRAERRLLTSN